MNNKLFPKVTVSPEEDFLRDEFIYLLWHTHLDQGLDGGEDVKLIGVYSTELKAREAQERALLLPGFIEHPKGFEISCCKIDKDNWTSGFFTVQDI
jgi:hypothetical protein